jgi:hypothetical protein
MSFKVTKLTVGKGKTVGDEKAGKWEREYFELEAVIEEESALELAKGSLESLLDTWLKGETITPQEKQAVSTSPLKLDMNKINALPWKAYKQGHRAGWIFADLPEAKELLEATKTQPNERLSLGDFDFKITHGTDRDFIARYPRKSQ